MKTRQHYPKLINILASRITQAISPEKIILFGSYAYGKPNRDSDIDLLVIHKSSERPIERRRKLDSLFEERMVPVDLLWITPQEVRRRISGFDPFLEEVLDNGKVIYEKKR